MATLGLNVLGGALKKTEKKQITGAAQRPAWSQRPEEHR
jgi:hypothetical protein